MSSLDVFEVSLISVTFTKNQNGTYLRVRMWSLQQRWCSRDGVLERFELADMDESDRCRNEDVDGVDGVVCRELDDALVTDL
jgi:hypothetical protein